MDVCEKWIFGGLISAMAEMCVVVGYVCVVSGRVGESDKPGG